MNSYTKFEENRSINAKDGHFCSGSQHLVSCSVLVGNLYPINESSIHIINPKYKQINHDNVQDESKTRTHRYNKLPSDVEPWTVVRFVCCENSK